MLQDFFDSGTKAAPAEAQYGAPSFSPYDQTAGGVPSAFLLRSPLCSGLPSACRCTGRQVPVLKSIVHQKPQHPCAVACSWHSDVTWTICRALCFEFFATLTDVLTARLVLIP